MVKWTTWISKFLGNFFSNSKSSLTASPLDIAFKFISKCLALPMPYSAFSLGFWTTPCNFFSAEKSRAIDLMIPKIRGGSKIFERGGGGFSKSF